MQSTKSQRAGVALPARQNATKRTQGRAPEALQLAKQQAYERYMSFHKGRHKPPTGEPAPAKAGAGGGGNPEGGSTRAQAFHRAKASAWPARGRAQANAPQQQQLQRRPFSKPAAMQVQQALKSAVVIPFPKRK